MAVSSAASGYLDYDPIPGKFTLPPEQAMVFANSDSPVYLQGAFGAAVALMENQAAILNLCLSYSMLPDPCRET
jgi:hypothetical protein